MSSFVSNYMAPQAEPALQRIQADARSKRSAANSIEQKTIPALEGCQKSVPAVKTHKVAIRALKVLAAIAAVASAVVTFAVSIPVGIALGVAALASAIGAVVLGYKAQQSKKQAVAIAKQNAKIAKDIESARQRAVSLKNKAAKHDKAIKEHELRLQMARIGHNLDAYYPHFLRLNRDAKAYAAQYVTAK